MIKEGKIGFTEGFALLLISNIGRVYLTLPGVAMDEGKNMGWALIIIGTVNSLISFWIIALLMKRYHGFTIVEVSESLLGKILGTIINLLFYFYFLAVVVTLERAYSEAIIISALPRTPISIVMVTILVGMIISCYYGVEVLSRVARSSISYILVGLLIVYLSAISLVDFTNIYPLWSIKPYKIFELGILRYSLVSEGLLAAVIINVFDGWKNFNRAGMMSLYTGGFILFSIVLIVLLTFGVQNSEELVLPAFNLSRHVTLGRFLQGIESIFFLTWGMVGFIKLAITLYAATAILARVLKLSDYRPILLIHGVLCLSLSILPNDFATASNIENDFIRVYGLIPTEAIPLLLLLVSLFKRTGRQQTDG